jgi:large subunit ribosomal protein L21
MFAIVKTGGKQYKVKPDDIINVERLEGEEGAEIALEVLMYVNLEGDLSFENNITVKAAILSNFRGIKVIAFKKRRRHTYKKKKGHRQDLTKLKIISFENKEVAAKESKNKKLKNTQNVSNIENTQNIPNIENIENISNIENIK